MRNGSTPVKLIIMKKNRRLFNMLLIAFLLILIPWGAMLFTTEVNWKAGDFIAAAVLLGGTALVCEWILRRVQKPALRIILCTALVTGLLLTWLELAVSIFGTPLAGH